MAPLSGELSGLILRHDFYNSHLNSACKTIDKDLEKENFAYAGETLANVWSKITIDNYPVHAEFVTEEAFVENPSPESAEWYNTHVRESQYFLQV